MKKKYARNIVRTAKMETLSLTGTRPSIQDVHFPKLIRKHKIKIDSMGNQLVPCYRDIRVNSK